MNGPVARHDVGGVAAAWTRFWFEPADARPLAIVRILAALLGLALLWSYADDLQSWFGPQGMIPPGSTAEWRPRFSLSLLDLATTASALRLVFIVTAVAFAALLVGVATPLAALAAAILWASLLNRGPMLAGPADDCLAVLLWCLAVGPCGASLSVDRLLATGRGRPRPGPSSRARLSLGLLQVHAAVIAAAALLAQVKGDVWWDGTAAWWLSARAESRLVDLSGVFQRSEYLMNLVTHAILAFEGLFAAGLWFQPTKALVARMGLVAWPLLGVLTGEPAWGAALAVFCLPFAAGSPRDVCSERCGR
jgi:hypothetical protein